MPDLSPGAWRRPEREHARPPARVARCHVTVGRRPCSATTRSASSRWPARRSGAARRPSIAAATASAVAACRRRPPGRSCARARRRADPPRRRRRPSRRRLPSRGRCRWTRGAAQAAQRPAGCQHGERPAPSRCRRTVGHGMVTVRSTLRRTTVAVADLDLRPAQDRPHDRGPRARPRPRPARGPPAGTSPTRDGHQQDGRQPGRHGQHPPGVERYTSVGTTAPCSQNRPAAPSLPAVPAPPVAVRVPERNLITWRPTPPTSPAWRPS